MQLGKSCAKREERARAQQGTWKGKKPDSPLLSFRLAGKWDNQSAFKLFFTLLICFPLSERKKNPPSQKKSKSRLALPPVFRLPLSPPGQKKERTNNHHRCKQKIGADDLVSVIVVVKIVTEKDKRMAASRRFSNTTRSNCAYANGGGVGGGSDFIEPKDDKSTTAGSGSTGTTTTTITTTTRAVVDPNHALGSGPDGLGRRDDEEEDTAPESSIGEFDPVDILDLDSDSQCWQTVRSSVYRHFWERGRRYHRYRYGRYPIPNDDEEQHRDELKHCMHMEITE